MTPIAAVLMLTVQQSAVPPPVEQFTADCAAPVYASERLICSDSELLGTEAQIADLWRAAQPNWSPGPWLEQQEAWFRRRALCAFQTEHRACLQGANAERVRVLAAASRRPGAIASPARCISEDVSQTVSVDRRDQTLAAYDQHGLTWLASRADTHWRPFTVWEGGRSLTVVRADGTRLTCRVDP
jgi:uncharacterized protein